MNIEMQKGSGNDDIKRNRFYAASTTAAYTPKGTDFSDIPQVVILYITEYDALHNGQMITHVKRCMDTQEGYVPVDDGEEIFFANTVVRDDSDKSELLQLFLRKDAFEDVKFPELSRAVKYFKETEGGFGEMCKTVEDYANVGWSLYNQISSSFFDNHMVSLLMLPFFPIIQFKKSILPYFSVLSGYFTPYLNEEPRKHLSPCLREDPSYLIASTYGIA